MKIVEIKALPNGGHRNQETDKFLTIPDGWAVVPDDITTKNFPFGEVVVEDIGGVKTVTEWIAGVVPKTEEIEQPLTELEKLRADIDFIAIMTGVEL